MALPNEPLTRSEQYLNRIATGEGTIPDEPLTRVEQYLDYIAENSGSGGGGGSVTVDSALSDSSTNPVQNKVVKAALDAKADESDIPTVPAMATQANMSDWTSGKTVDAAALKTDFQSALQALSGKQDKLFAGQNVAISGNTISADVDSAEIASNVTNWLNANVTPVGSAVAIDSSLSVFGSAADAKVTGDALKYFGWNETYSPSVDEADGYFNTSGGISPASSTTLEKYTQKFYVTEGEKVTYSLTYPQAQAMWLSYCTYNANGGFIQRANPANTTTQTFSGTITVPNGVAAIAFSYRTYGDHDFVVNLPNPRTDKTLTIENVPADAKAAGERADGIQDALSGYLPIDFTVSTGWRGTGNHTYSDSAYYHVDLPVAKGEKYHIKTCTNNASVKGAELFQDASFDTLKEVFAGTESGYIEGYVTIPEGYAYLTVNCVHAESVVIEKYGYLADAETELPTYFANEVASVISTAKENCGEKSLVFAVVTDTHLNVNRGYQVWNDTVKNIAAVNAKYPLDGIIHMGDIINGNAASSVGIEQLDKVRTDLLSITQNVVFLEGNHDLNSFYNSNADPINEASMFSEVFRFNDTEIVRPDGKLYGYRDYDALGIRVVYLHSSMGDGTHGGLGDNWGYPQDELTWVQNVALDTEYQVLFISHMPMTEGHVSDASNLPANGDALKTIVSDFIGNGGVVVGLLHGHTHWDDILNNGKFNEVSVCCEDYTYLANELIGTAIQSYAPASAVRPARMRYTVTQDLWDVVIVSPASRTVKLVRFGAGADRAFSY